MSVLQSLTFFSPRSWTISKQKANDLQMGFFDDIINDYILSFVHRLPQHFDFLFSY